MKTISLIAAPVLVSAATLAAAQTPPSSHEQHQAAGQHEAKAGEDHCAQMMREMHEMHQMMAEMMKMHQGMAAHSGHDAAKDKTQDQPKH
ncbi:hypothetical protein [Sphingomonas hankyongi]|uniref:Uncharacterized protein n=1 Tax=Sphingomonas hankyongi TaxID=2908209 RepID=A0ABT0S2Y7_9SPHN|nr:hypothetical protein [Sphingomonas hankyongi]MCL6730237.1 hypothetical protein [Sphingomonas hankyongi]